MVVQPASAASSSSSSSITSSSGHASSPPAPPPPPPTLYPHADPIVAAKASSDQEQTNEIDLAALLSNMNVSGAAGAGPTAAAAAAATTAIAVATTAVNPQQRLGANGLPVLGSASMGTTPKPNKKRPYPFALGGIAASVSACCTHPLDLAKNRMQTTSAPAGSTLKTLRSVIRPSPNVFEPLALYTGLSASLARQFSYSLVRFGAYDSLKAQLASPEEREGKKRMGIGKSILCASLAGAAGGIAGNPADILLVRMTSDANLPPSKRYNYSNALVGLVRMAREEGLSSYARGLLPNTVRAVLMNASQLATYDVFKDALVSSGLFSEGIMLHFTASFCAGTVATTVCSPADVIKARVMSGSSSSSGGLGALRVALQKEGPAFLFRGFIPAWIRLSPNTVITFITLERLRMMVDWQRDSKARRDAALVK